MVHNEPMKYDISQDYYIDNRDLKCLKMLMLIFAQNILCFLYRFLKLSEIFSIVVELYMYVNEN